MASDELVDRPIATPDVQFVLDVFTKSQDAEATAQEEGTLPDPWGDLRQSKDFPTTQVGIEIHTGQRWQACAAIDIAADDGTTPTAGAYTATGRSSPGPHSCSVDRNRTAPP